jgi:hypothetical protein
MKIFYFNFFFLKGFFRMQDGEKIQDGRQSLNCSRYVKTAPKNFNHWKIS